MPKQKKAWVDFRLVKERVTIQMVLDHYGINWLRKKNAELVGRCPIPTHKGEGDRTFNVNITKNAFQCFSCSCKARGNVLDLVAAMDNCSVRDAALNLQDWFSIDDGETLQTPTQEIAKSEVEQSSGPINPPLTFQLGVDTSHDYGEKRGLSVDTIFEFGAGACTSRGMFSCRYLIPLHNEAGELVGYAGRSTDDSEPKYLFPPSEKGFYKSHLLFNLHRVIKQSWPDELSKLVIVVEGFFSAMHLHQAGFPVVSLLGSSMSEWQEEMLIANFNRVVLLLDGDEAGRNASGEIAARLVSKLYVKVVSLFDGQQPDTLQISDVTALLNI